MRADRLSPLALALLLALGCAKAPPSFEEPPSAETLYGRGLERLDDAQGSLWFLPSSDYQKAIETFQEIIDNYPYSDYAVLAELKIADAYFSQRRYEEALTYYRDFADLHPSHPQVSYAVYRSALCYYEQAEDPQRDQTATRESLHFLDLLLARHPASPHIVQAEELWRELRGRLAEHVLEIGDFYMDRDEYQSAADRYRSVLNEYPGLGYDAEALYKLGVCYSNMSLEEEATRVFEVILRNYRDSDVADAAADLVPAAQ